MIKNVKRPIYNLLGRSVIGIRSSFIQTEKLNIQYQVLYKI